MKDHSQAPVWSVPVAVESIPESGFHLIIEPDPSQRAAIAALAGLRELPLLTATFDLTHRSKQDIVVTGTVTAQVGQTCVVTLEPVVNEISEEVDVVFSSAPVAPPASHTDEDGVADPPEPIVNGVIDLGVLATEYLVIGIDPYPRKPGVEFTPVVEAADPEDHPFAALAALKGGESGKNPKKPQKTPKK
jgi:uncharacterized metal-binding protein YceD (DUF177 family)